jgi:hypothetical protein
MIDAVQQLGPSEAVEPDIAVEVAVEFHRQCAAQMRMQLERKVMDDAEQPARGLLIRATASRRRSLSSWLCRSGHFTPPDIAARRSSVRGAETQ